MKTLGPQLPEKGEYVDDRFLLLMPDGSRIEHAWTGKSWANCDTLFLIEESLKDRDKPAVVHKDGDPIPLRIFCP